jgi:Amt family ammonium transporter
VGSNGVAGIAMANTQIATAAAAIAWLFAEWLTKGKPSVLGILSGAVAGLVAITPACGFVTPMGALWIGLAAGVVCFLSAVYVKRWLGYDDSLDAFGIHGVGGALGAILTGVFATTAVNFGEGAIDGNVAQIWVQVKGVAISAAYCAVATFVILKVIDVVIGLRVSKEVEVDGLDLNLHGETLHS